MQNVCCYFFTYISFNDFVVSMWVTVYTGERPIAPFLYIYHDEYNGLFQHKTISWKSGNEWDQPKL